MRKGLALLGVLFSIGWSQAQVSVPPIDLTLNTASTTVVTGSRVPITLELANVDALWLLNVEITYDPQKVYIIGTQSGQPLTLTGIFTGGSNTVVRNSAQEGRLAYTISMLAPADPVSSSSGILGSFTVYPLSAGDTTLTFAVVEAIRVNFSGEGESRQSDSQLMLPVAPQNLTLSITGDTVEIPPEPTATPQPTATTEALNISGVAQNEPTVQATFVQSLILTATPPTLIEELPMPAEGLSSVMVLAAVLIGAAVVGLVGLFAFSRRRR